MSRRRFFASAGAAALVTTVPPVATAQPAGAAALAGTPAASGESYLFFNADEAAFVEAAVQRLIPPDELGPGALEAGVATYIDRQMHGAWGAGERLYRSGPWLPGTPTQGYQLPFTPAELFRTALRAIRADLDRAGRPTFDTLPGADQDLYLTLLQAGERELDGVPSKVFFESLWGLTIEGYFGDPIYGGNRGMAAWRMIGFPGAYGAYYDLVDQDGVAFTQPPRSIADGPSSGGHGAYRGHHGHHGPHAGAPAQGQTPTTRTVAPPVSRRGVSATPPSSAAAGRREGR